MRISILGKRWTLKFVDARTMPDARGACESPDSPRKEIRVRKNLRGEELLEVILHEAIHAAYWHADENDFVAPLAEDLARLLYRKLNYRRKGTDDAA